MKRWKKLGIIAGGGMLPIELAHHCQIEFHDFFVIRLEGIADEGNEMFPGRGFSIFEAGAIFRTLREQKCDAIVMAGMVQRPDFSTIRPDWRGAALLSKFAAAAIRGDGALLSAIVEAFEAEGFMVVGADEVLGHVVPDQGALGIHAPDDQDFSDIKKAVEVIRALGPFDIGQGAVVAAGQVLGIEAVEGTDEMLDRCGRYYERLSLTPPLGVLTKIPKPGQELRVDLPTIGLQTIILASETGLRGVAVLSGAALILNREEMIEAANAKGIFVYGFTLDELAKIKIPKTFG